MAEKKQYRERNDSEDSRGSHSTEENRPLEDPNLINQNRSGNDDRRQVGHVQPIRQQVEARRGRENSGQRDRNEPPLAESRREDDEHDRARRGASATSNRSVEEERQLHRENLRRAQEEGNRRDDYIPWDYTDRRISRGENLPEWYVRNRENDDREARINPDVVGHHTNRGLDNRRLDEEEMMERNRNRTNQPVVTQEVIDQACRELDAEREEQMRREEELEDHRDRRHSEREADLPNWYLRNREQDTRQALRGDIDRETRERRCARDNRRLDDEWDELRRRNEGREPRADYRDRRQVVDRQEDLPVWYIKNREYEDRLERRGRLDRPWRDMTRGRDNRRLDEYRRQHEDRNRRDQGRDREEKSGSRRAESRPNVARSPAREEPSKFSRSTGWAHVPATNWARSAGGIGIGLHAPSRRELVDMNYQPMDVNQLADVLAENLAARSRSVTTAYSGRRDNNKQPDRSRQSKPSEDTTGSEADKGAPPKCRFCGCPHEDQWCRKLKRFEETGSIAPHAKTVPKNKGTKHGPPPAKDPPPTKRDKTSGVPATIPEEGSPPTTSSSREEFILGLSQQELQELNEAIDVRTTTVLNEAVQGTSGRIEDPRMNPNYPLIRKEVEGEIIRSRIAANDLVRRAKSLARRVAVGEFDDEASKADKSKEEKQKKKEEKGPKTPPDSCRKPDDKRNRSRSPPRGNGRFANAPWDKSAAPGRTTSGSSAGGGSKQGDKGSNRSGGRDGGHRRKDKPANQGFSSSNKPPQGQQGQKPSDKGPMKRASAPGSEAKWLTSKEGMLDPSLDYFIIRRDWNVAIGILNYHKDDRMKMTAPLFMQFGCQDKPKGADNIYVFDTISVAKYAYLAQYRRPDEARPYQPGNSDPESWMIRNGEIVPSCAGITYHHKRVGRNRTLNEVGQVTDTRKVVEEGRGTFRWRIGFVSESFQSETQAGNRQISGDEDKGWNELPEPPEWLSLNYYSLQKGQARTMGQQEYVLPHDNYEECGRIVQEGKNALMFMEKVTDATRAILDKNKGIGCGTHTAESYNKENNIIRQGTAATSAGEKTKMARDIERAKTFGNITEFGEDHTFKFEVDNPPEKPLKDEAVVSIARHMQKFSEAILEYIDHSGKYRKICDVNVTTAHTSGGLPSYFMLRRIIRIYTRPRGIPIRREEAAQADQLAIDVANIPLPGEVQQPMEVEQQPEEQQEEEPMETEAVQAEENMEEGEIPTTNRQEEESSDDDAVEADFDATGLSDEAFFKAKRFPTTNLRLRADPNRTGLEDRVKLIALTHIYVMKNEAENLRDELRNSLIPLTSCQEKNMMFDAPDDYRLIGWPCFHSTIDGAPFYEWLQRGPTIEHWNIEQGIHIKPSIFIPDDNMKLDDRDSRDLDDCWERLQKEGLLNFEQKLAVAAIILLFRPCLYVRAPAGTGKTWTLGMICAYGRKYRPEERFLCVANNNEATEKLLEDIIKGRDHLQEEDDKAEEKKRRESDEAINAETAVGTSNEEQKRPDLDILFIQSQIMSVRDAVNPRGNKELLEEYGLIAHAKRLVEKYKDVKPPPDDFGPTEANLERVEEFLAIKEENPGCYSIEDDVLNIVLNHSPHIRVTVSTLGKMLQRCANHHEAHAHYGTLLVDECGQARHIDVQTLTHRTGVAQLLVTGDDKQLDPWVDVNWEKIDKYYKYQRHAISEHFMKFLLQRTVELKKTYRFNWEMAKLISKTLYDGKVEPGGKAADHEEAYTRNIPVACTKLPVTFVHTTSPAARAQGKSLANFGQEDAAVAIACMLRRKHKEGSITIVCYYSGSAHNLRERLPKEPEFESPGGAPWSIHTVHSYIGQEADYVILVTTKTRAGTTGESSFVHEPRISTVALTRGKEALWVVGHMDFLVATHDPNDREMFTVLHEFVADGLQMSPSLDALQYINYAKEFKEDTIPQYNEEGFLLKSEGFSGVTMFAKCAADEAVAQGEYIPYNEFAKAQGSSTSKQSSSGTTQ